ncbi:hypothetical protein TNCV_1901881 [Trichonephila clavipes]|nr:hypothetical protein TNCV_1901881 [Trichonephila clavipes]
MTSVVVNVVIVVAVSLPKGRNKGWQGLRLVGLLHDKWRHHLSPPPKFRHATGRDGKIFQPPHTWFLPQPPTRLSNPWI